MTEKIKNVLRTTKDVTVFREELQLMYAVIDEKIPLFEKDMFSKVETFDSLWEKLSSCWSIYDYDLLMQIVKTSDSEEAKLIFQDFVSKIDSFTEGVDLVLVSALHEKKENKGKNPKSVLRIKVDAKRCNCYMKNKIKKFLHKHYKLEKYALHFKEITKGCIEINFKVSEKTLSYIEQYPTYGYDVPKFLNLKIKSIRIENRETKIVRVNAVSTVHIYVLWIFVCIYNFLCSLCALLVFVNLTVTAQIILWLKCQICRQHHPHFYKYDSDICNTAVIAKYRRDINWDKP